ncbi:MAG TPA: DUF4440 domain-containing protein [Thermoanaerobaculaceae bacterium]|nr:DUF4440 domain-containing protein [Thermoanaerobaculaceae bacterium]
MSILGGKEATMRAAMAAGCVLAVALGSAQAPGNPAANGREALMQVDLEFGRAAARDGLTGWLAYHAADAVIFPTGGPIVTGLEAIKAAYAKSGFTPAGLTWTPAGAELAASGELGYTYGTWEWRGTDRDGKPALERGKYLTVWRRQADGGWKLAADIGNTDAPRPAATP